MDSTGATDSGTTGDCTWSFDESTGTLTISGNGKMKDFSVYPGDDGDLGECIDLPWFLYLHFIKKIVIEDGVTSIGEDAFYDCSNLTSITTPNSVTYIEYGVFSGC